MRRGIFLISLLLPAIAIAQPVDILYGDWVAQNESTPITDGTSTSFKAGITGAQHYMTDISCSNTGGTASRIKLLCASTVKWNGFLAATTGTDGQTFTAARKCASGEAVNVQLATSGSSTICTVGGFTRAVP